MFLSKLIEITAQTKMAFEVESKDGIIIFTAIPKKIAPEATGAVAQAHVALAMPLRVSVEDNEEADTKIIAELGSYIMKRNPLQSNLDVLNKTLAEATQSVKQETKEKEGDSPKTSAVKKKSESEKSVSTPSDQPKELDL